MCENQLLKEKLGVKGMRLSCNLWYYVRKDFVVCKSRGIVSMMKSPDAMANVMYDGNNMCIHNEDGLRESEGDGKSCGPCPVWYWLAVRPDEPSVTTMVLKLQKYGGWGGGVVHLICSVSYVAKKRVIGFKLGDYITLICNMFRFKCKKPSSGEIRVPNKICNVDDINSLFVSLYIVETSTLQCL
jgi:hypothetical protein